MLYAMRLAFSAKHYMIATDLAAKVAPYVHPRLMAAQVKHEGTLTLEQLVMESMELPIAQAMIEGDVMPADGSSTAAQMVTAEIDATRALPNGATTSQAVELAFGSSRLIGSRCGFGGGVGVPGGSYRAIAISQLARL